MVCTYNLDHGEVDRIEGIVALLAETHRSVETLEFLTDCALAAGHLPDTLRRTLRTFRNRELGSSAVVVRGFTIDDTVIGDTPPNWDAPWSEVPYLREEIFQCLLMSAVGDIFGYRTLENGRFLRHVTPEDGKARDQVAGSSAVTLEWHTEEAFHPARGDFQSLMCYRNHERAETNLAQVTDLELPAHTWEILRQPRFLIRPDQAHCPGEYAESSGEDDEVFRNVLDLIENPKPRPLVYGPRHCPFIVIDQAFMEPLAGDAEATAALTAVLSALDAANRRLVLSPGEVLLFDNQRAPHGRSAFTPLKGSHKRWLRVLYGTADLQKSLEYRASAISRTVG